MKRFIAIVLALLLLAGGAFAQTTDNSETEQLKKKVEQLEKLVASMEKRLAATEQNAATQPAAQAVAQPMVQDGDVKEQLSVLKADLKEVASQASAAERRSALDRINWSGDFRTQSNSIFGTVPNYYNGMKLQNYMVRTLWMFSPNSSGGLGMAFDPNMLANMSPAQFSAFQGAAVQQNYSQYQYYTNNVTFGALKSGFGAFSPAQQQMLQSYLMQAPGVYTKGYQADANALLTSRLRLNFDSNVSDNVSVTARLSMYKVFGDSTGVQVFNGQASTLSIDGTTTGVPTGDMLRVERAYFTWKDIGGSKLYLSVGRRPSTDGPPMNFRDDEPRGGTPSGALINYQFDGLTLGYHVSEKTSLRLCYGLGYDAGYGNGQLLQNPADRLRSVHFLGANLDLYATDKALVQATIAKAWNVTDGFNGQMVLPNNPLTGDAITAPVIMRYTPSANLGYIMLYGLNAQVRVKDWDVYTSFNANGLRPNGVTTPFGGLGSDPFETPKDHNGWMGYVGLRYSVPKDDGRTKMGFEYNHGSKYWFNFAQAEDDILAPKTSVRGNAYETYFTHRISQRFILKVDYQRFQYDWSGSGWHIGAPKKMDQLPLLGFPTYDNANLLTFGLTARF